MDESVYVQTILELNLFIHELFASCFCSNVIKKNKKRKHKAVLKYIFNSVFRLDMFTKYETLYTLCLKVVIKIWIMLLSVFAQNYNMIFCTNMIS